MDWSDSVIDPKTLRSFRSQFRTLPRTTVNVFGVIIRRVICFYRNLIKNNELIAVGNKRGILREDRTYVENDDDYNNDRRWKTKRETGGVIIKNTEIPNGRGRYDCLANDFGCVAPNELRVYGRVKRERREKLAKTAERQIDGQFRKRNATYARFRGRGVLRTEPEKVAAV